MDRSIVVEGLSALLGVPITSLPDGDSGNGPVLNMETFLPAVWLRSLDPALLKHVRPSLISDCTNSAIRKEMFINEKEFFHPMWDFDFTNITDSHERGGEVYKRPGGWNRIALKVSGKYKDGNAWLGCSSSPGEWPVSYHGTTIEGAVGIIQSGYKAGPHGAYGRGIYSTPDIDVAESHGYAKTFISKMTGKTYKIALQNRINPNYRKICVKDSHWLVPVPEGTSAEREKEIVTSAIRPYGLLLKEM